MAGIRSSATIVLAIIVATIMFIANRAFGEQLVDSKLGFRLIVPEGFQRDETPMPGFPDIVYKYIRKAEAGETGNCLLAIERMRGVIGRERLTLQNIPSRENAQIKALVWQDFELGGLMFDENLNGIAFTNLNIQVPLKNEAIIVRIVGPASESQKLIQLAETVLKGLKGESNWLSSLGPQGQASSKIYSLTLLVVGGFVFIGGIVLLFVFSKRIPKGVVLLLAVMMYLLSWMVDSGRSAELHLLTGLLRMGGFVGLILGLVDVVRSRRPRSHAMPEQMDVHSSGS